MTSKNQATKAKNYLATIINFPIGLAYDNSGYFLKVHLPQSVVFNIPTTIEGVRVIVDITGSVSIY